MYFLEGKFHIFEFKYKFQILEGLTVEVVLAFRLFWHKQAIIDVVIKIIYRNII